MKKIFLFLSLCVFSCFSSDNVLFDHDRFVRDHGLWCESFESGKVLDHSRGAGDLTSFNPIILTTIKKWESDRYRHLLVYVSVKGDIFPAVVTEICSMLRGCMFQRMTDLSFYNPETTLENLTIEEVQELTKKYGKSIEDERYRRLALPPALLAILQERYKKT